MDAEKAAQEDGPGLAPAEAVEQADAPADPFETPAPAPESDTSEPSADDVFSAFKS